MSIVIFLLFFIEGFGISLFFTRDRLLCLASAVLIPIFCSNIFLIACNALDVSFEATYVYTLHLVLFTIAILKIFSIRRKIFDASFYLNIKKHKFIIATLFIFLFAFLVRNQTQLMWPGDGMEMWATRALEWGYFKRLNFSPVALEKLKTWLNYPIFHSLTILTAQLLYSSPSILSSNNFDSFFIVGIFFSNYFYLSKHITNKKVILIVSLLITFCLRDLIAMVGSAYADIFLCYCFNLVTVVLLSRIEENHKNSWKTVVFLSILFSSLALAKSEGLYRLIILLFIFILIMRKEFKVFTPSIVLTIVIYLIFKKSNPATSTYSHYISDLNLNVNFLMERLNIVLESFWLSFWDSYNIAKTFKIHILMMAILPIFLIKDKRINISLIFLLTTFFINLFFNYTPFLVTQIDGEVFNNPTSIAKNVTSRLNLQISYSVILVGVLFFKDYINKLSNRFL